MLTVIFVESSGSSGSHMLVLQTLRASRRGRLGIAFFFNVSVNATRALPWPNGGSVCCFIKTTE